MTKSTVDAVFSPASASRAFVCACNADQLADENLVSGHGVFTSALLEGLGGDAADKNGDITVHSLYDYVALSLKQEVQNVTFRADVEDRIVFASGLDPGLVSLVPDKSAVASAEQKAEDLLDGYSRHLRTGLEEWRLSGYREASQRLEPICDWFERRLLALPGLLESQRFMDLHRSMVGRLVQLGAVDPGTHVDEGVLQEEIGTGAFGTVWKVRHADESYSAFKIYHPNELSNTRKVSRFKNGYDAMKQLEHPAIVRVRRYTKSPIGFFMDYVDGPNLRVLGPRNLELLECLRLLKTVSEAIEHAHNRQVIHRDIKPENIVCSFENSQWQPHLTDFDLAWFATATQLTDIALGTVSYSAPEQYAHFNKAWASGFHPQLDIYSLGQLTYFLFTGSDPAPGQRTDNLHRLEQRLSEIPSASAAQRVHDLYVGCTRESPGDRIATMSAVREFIADALSFVETSPDIHPTASSFLNQLVYELTGEIREIPSERSSFGFDSRTGQTSIDITVSERTHARRESYLVEASLIHNGESRMGMDALSNDKMRRILNERIDHALDKYGTSVTRRAGTSGIFSTHILTTAAKLNREALATCRNAVADVLAVIEAM